MGLEPADQEGEAAGEHGQLAPVAARAVGRPRVDVDERPFERHPGVAPGPAGPRRAQRQLDEDAPAARQPAGRGQQAEERVGARPPLRVEFVVGEDADWQVGPGPEAEGGGEDPLAGGDAGRIVGRGDRAGPALGEDAGERPGQPPLHGGGRGAGQEALPVGRQRDLQRARPRRGQLRQEPRGRGDAGPIEPGVDQFQDARGGRLTRHRPRRAAPQFACRSHSRFHRQPSISSVACRAFTPCPNPRIPHQ